MGQTRASRRPRTRPSAPPRHKARPPTKRKMKSTALAVALAVATVSTCLAEKEETYLEAATHFCGKSEPDSDHPQVLLTHFYRSSTRRDADHQQQAMRMGGDGCPSLQERPRG